ncbi:MFS transporter [Oxalobacteraceae bacterium]|nr:MFS transporter [Oxalobacteraceae bacterium]
MGLALGARHVQGLFLLPMTMERGWGREQFALAIALQNLVWGLAMPFTGMLADKFGSAKILFGGCLLYALGLYLMANARSNTELLLSSGLLVGVALSATTFGVVYGALSRIMAPDMRSWALGLAGAVGGLGQFLMVPLTQGFIVAYGWVMALVLMAGMLFAASPLARNLSEKPAAAAPGRPVQSLGQAIHEALEHRGFWLLNLGFLACGFQLAFIAGHLPAYLMDKGLSPRSAVIALSIIALANIPGTYVWGVLGARFRRKHLLAYIYLFRSVAMAIFISLPLHESTVYVFAFAMGFVWLGTVPLTNGLVSQVFGVKYLTTLFGFVFVGHQLGAFFGMWLGGVVFDAGKSYDPLWIGSIALGLVAAALHWPINDRLVGRLQVAA